MRGKAEIGLVTVGERPTMLEPLHDGHRGAEGARSSRIFQRTGAGAYLLDGIVDVSRGLEKREAKRPVIVVLTFERRRVQQPYYEQVLRS